MDKMTKKELLELCKKQEEELKFKRWMVRGLHDRIGELERNQPVVHTGTHPVPMFTSWKYSQTGNTDNG